MNKQRTIITTLIIGLIFIFPLSSFASIDTNERVVKQGVVNDDYYAAGETINIDADVAGDVVISGGDLFIGHRIQGDLMAVGGSINLRGKILDDVRIAGGEISIDATISDDIFAAGGKVNVSSGTSVNGEAWLGGGDIYMGGTINKGLHIGGGNIIISGTVHGDVELEGGDIQIIKGTLIEGNLHYKSPNEAMIHPDAKIMGKVVYEESEWDDSHQSYGVFFSLTMIIASFVLFWLFPGFTISSASRINSDPWKSLGVGFAMLIVAPIASILLMGIMLGVWVGLSIFALYFVALPIGYLIGCFFVGDWGARLLHKDVTTTSRRLLSVAIAIAIIGILQLIPVLGGLLTFALILLGLGAGILQLQFVYRQTDVK